LHPVRKEPLHIVAPLPELFSKLLKDIQLENS
jgi:pseudouridylate synthase